MVQHLTGRSTEFFETMLNTSQDIRPISAIIVNLPIRVKPNLNSHTQYPERHESLRRDIWKPYYKTFINSKFCRGTV